MGEFEECEREACCALTLFEEAGNVWGQAQCLLLQVNSHAGLIDVVPQCGQASRWRALTLRRAGRASSASVRPAAQHACLRTASP